MDEPLSHKRPADIFLCVFSKRCSNSLPLCGRERGSCSPVGLLELKLELIQIQMTQKPMLRVEVGMRVRCANEANAE